MAFSKAAPAGEADDRARSISEAGRDACASGHPDPDATADLVPELARRVFGSGEAAKE
jgi:hypothetical protein